MGAGGKAFRQTGEKMEENISQNEKQKKKINKSVVITGIILNIALVITGIFVISKAILGADMTPYMVIAGSAWSLLAMPLALATFIVSLLWNNTQNGKQFTIKTIVTVVIMFFFMLYFMFAVLMVWVVKIDNTPAGEDTDITVFIEDERYHEEFS